MAGNEIDSGKKDLIIKGAYRKMNTYRTKGFGIEKQSTDLVTWLKGQDEVEDVSLHGDTDITVKFKDKTQVGILLGREKIYGGATRKTRTKEASYAPAVRSNDPHPISRKAAVIDPLRDDWPPASTPDGIFNLLDSSGYSVDYIKSDNANLDFFTSFDDREYGVVFIRTHGGIMNVDGDDKLHIMVRPFFASFPPTSGYKGIGVFTVYTDVLPQGYAYAYAFNDLFVKEYMNNKHFPNSLFHLLVCHGGDPAANDDMIKAFLDRGVGCYTGWTLNASSTYGDPAAVEFFKVLCDKSANPTRTVNDAVSRIASMGSSPDPDTGALLVAQGSPGMQIINYFMIEEISQITIREPGGKVIGKGFLDVLDAMEFGTNQVLSGKYSGVQIVQSVNIKKIVI